MNCTKDEQDVLRYDFRNAKINVFFFPWLLKYLSMLFNLPANLDSNLVIQSVYRNSLDHLRWLRLACDP